MKTVIRLRGVLGIGILISTLVPVGVLASDIENELFQSCLSSSQDPQKESNQEACSCYANKIASGKVKSFGEAKDELEIDAQFQQELIENWNREDWLPPDFQLGSTDIVSLNEEQAKKFVIFINVGFACYQEIEGVNFHEQT